MKVIRNDRDNRYCGPAALSLITGRPVSECTEELRRHTGQRAIRGVYRNDLLDVSRRMGTRLINVPVIGTPGQQRPTLVKLLRQLRERHADDVYLINITGHYIVLKGIKLFDNVNPDGVFIRRYAHRRKRVKYVWMKAR